LILLAAAGAQSLPSGPTFQLVVGVTDEAPHIDGVLEADEWAGAVVASDFIQFQPRRGSSATERTEALVLQDDQAIYVAFRVWDSQSPTAQITRRDASLTSDDMVGFILDTYRDHQTAYLFMTNLLSTQHSAG